MRKEQVSAQAKQNGYTFIEARIWKGESWDDLYSINWCDEEVGWLNYHYNVTEGTHSKHTVYIACIELKPQYRNKGYGTKVIKHLFEQRYAGHTICAITGDAHTEAIGFWYKIGAKFELLRESLQYYIDNGYNVWFTLSKRKFKMHVNG